MKTIYESSDYGMFKLHEFNRDVNRTKFLENSMRHHGWIDAYPIHVILDKNAKRKKFKVVAGHHRLHVAMSLGIPIKYVICNDSGITIHELEKSTNRWSLSDYLTSYIRCGLYEYEVLQQYQRITGISLQNCISMLGGESAGSNNKINSFKNGTYKLGNPGHATIVKTIILHCKEYGIDWAHRNLFVQAVSRVVWVKEFKVNIFLQKIEKHTHLFEKQPNKLCYINLIESIYNRQNKNPIPITFLANNIAKNRMPKELRSKAQKI